MHQLSWWPAALAAVFVCVAYWVLSYFLRSDQIIQFGNYLLTSVSLGVLAAYGPATAYSMSIGKIRAALLSSGICLISFAAVEIRIWSIVLRITDWAWMRDSPWIGFFLMHAFVGYILLLAPPGAIATNIPSRSLVRTGILVGLGVLAASLLIGFGYDRELAP